VEIMKQNKIIVVGTGWSGAVISRLIVDELSREVTVIEKRNHIAGNMYDEYDEHGILIQRYGPHYFCTNLYETVEYISQYADLYEHIFQVRTLVDGKYIYCPYNFKTIIDLIGEKQAAVLFSKLRKKYGEKHSVSMYELTNCDDVDIATFANLLFEKVYRNYVAKMWGYTPEELDPGIVDRTPLFLNFSDRKGSLDFYYLPEKGYTDVFKKILSHERISIELNTNALDHISFNEEEKLVYYNNEAVDCLVFTGPIDELFGSRYGSLPYRAVDIKFDYHNEGSVLPVEVIYYPQADGYIRKTEYRKQMLDDSLCTGTVVSTEYPMAYNRNAVVGNEPYYPVLTKGSQDMYERYLQLSKKYSNLFLLGRLADFKYYDMDTAIKHAIEYFGKISSYLCE